MCLDGFNHVFRIQFHLQKNLLVSSEKKRKRLKFVSGWPMAEELQQLIVTKFNQIQPKWNVYLHCQQVEQLNRTKIMYVDVIISDEITYEAEGKVINGIYNSESLSENWKEITNQMENYPLTCCKYSIADFKKKYLENGRFDFLQNDKIRHTVIHYVQNLTFDQAQLELQILPCFFGVMMDTSHLSVGK